MRKLSIALTDTTEVSGRVSADSREKQTMKPTIRRWLALAIAFLGLYLGAPVCGLAQNNQGQNDQGTGIKLVVPNGTYVFQDGGYLPIGGTLVPLAAAGRTTFFPTSNLGGTTSGVLWASIDGQIVPISIKGTFTVNPDGSVTEIEQQTGGPGALLHFKDYPTPDGNIMPFVGTDPGEIVNGTYTR
jgi:hypothetical protein